jgi:alpha-glucoside transport system substrate-binding protein
MATGGPSSSAADAGAPIRVFVSYRRTDDPNFIGRLYDRLVDNFGDENVFRDIDSISAGSDFSAVIRETLANVDAVVALIGPNWHADRLSDERDFVRMELVDALQRRLPIIPVLIEDTPLPNADTLPEGLRPLLDINVARVRRDPDFRRDATRTIRDITELARAEQRRRHDAAAVAEREAEAERRRAAAEQAEREAAEAERQRVEREAAVAKAAAVAAERQAIADRLAREHAERTAEIRRLEDEYAARRLAEEKARLAELTEAQLAAAAEAAAAADELQRMRDSGTAGESADKSHPTDRDAVAAPSAASSGPIEQPAQPTRTDIAHGRSPAASRRRKRAAVSTAVVLIAGLVVVLIATQRDPNESDVPTADATLPPDVTNPDLGLAGTTVTLSRFETSDAVQSSLESAVQWFTDEREIATSFEVMTDLEADLDVLIDDGNPPDIAILPAGPIFADLAERGVLQALPADVTSSVAEHWHEDWLGFWNVDGTQFGVPAESGLKSLVWYVPSAFAERGYEVPESLTEFFALVDQMIADGETPLCVGIESGSQTGWPFTDWTEDLVLRQQGIDYYRQWIDHEIPFNDPGVVEAMQEVADLWALDGAVYAAAGSIAETHFADNAQPLLDGTCMMHRQADFFAPLFPEGTTFGSGTDEVSAFYFPSDVDRPALVTSVGAVAFRDAPEVWAVMEYLGSPEYADERQSAQAAWMAPTAFSGFLTANQGVDRSLFTDTEIGFLEVLATGSPAALDASDNMPAVVGNAVFWTEATALVEGEHDAQTAADNVEAAWPP